MRWLRPTLALISMLGVTVGFFIEKISPEAFLAIASVAITWFFKSRDEDKKNGV